MSAHTRHHKHAIRLFIQFLTNCTRVLCSTYPPQDYVKDKSYPQKELLADLQTLHSKVVAKVDHDLLRAVCPKGWKMDHTEHGCCELRRFNDAAELVQISKKPKRTRDLEAAAERQKVRCKRLRSGCPGRECGSLSHP